MQGAGWGWVQTGRGWALAGVLRNMAALQQGDFTVPSQKLHLPAQLGPVVPFLLQALACATAILSSSGTRKAFLATPDLHGLCVEKRVFSPKEKIAAQKDGTIMLSALGRHLRQQALQSPYRLHGSALFSTQAAAQVDIAKVFQRAITPAVADALAMKVRGQRETWALCMCQGMLCEEQLMRPLNRLPPLLHQTHCCQGYAVVDNLFGPDVASALRAEVVALFQVGQDTACCCCYSRCCLLQLLLLMSILGCLGLMAILMHSHQLLRS